MEVIEIQIVGTFRSGNKALIQSYIKLTLTTQWTLNTKGQVAASRRRLLLVPANRELLESSNSK